MHSPSLELFYSKFDPAEFDDFILKDKVILKVTLTYNWFAFFLE